MTRARTRSIEEVPGRGPVNGMTALIHLCTY